MPGREDARRESPWTIRFGLSLRENQQNLLLWVFIVLVLSISRVAHLWALRNFWPLEGSASGIKAALLRGIRFDCQAATYLVLLPLLLGSLCVLSQRLVPWARRTRGIVAALFVCTAPLLVFCSVGYYQEFEDRFNVFVFELFRAETWLTIQTMQGDYGLTQRLLLSGILSIGLWFVWRRVNHIPILSESQATWLSSTRLRRGCCAAVVALSFVMGLRVSLNSRPLEPTDAAVTRHRVFNKAVLNGFQSLFLATCEFRQSLKANPEQFQISDDQLLSALKTVAHERTGTGLAESHLLSGAPREGIYHQSALGNDNPPPEHVFLLIMESYDAWPFLDKYRSLHLVEEGKRLAAEGLHVKNFLPSTNCSLKSYLATSTGLHRTSYLQQREYPTSMASIFNRLGYRTRMIVGHSAMWYEMDEVAEKQGFAEFHGSAHIRGEAADEISAQDAELFDYVRSLLKPGEPSLNVIRTISAHGPYTVDLEQEGCLIEQLPPDLEAICTKQRGPLLTHLGHVKYSDKCLGRFIAQVEKEFPNSLFVITGDHQGRHFLHGRPTEVERACVPLILYGKQILRGKTVPAGAAGSHIDITATLVNLAAPRGFRFESLGNNLLLPTGEHLGISETHLIGSNFIINFQEQPLVCHGLPGSEPGLSGRPKSAGELARLEEVFRAYHAVSGWLGHQQTDERWEQILYAQSRSLETPAASTAQTPPKRNHVEVSWDTPTRR